MDRLSQINVFGLNEYDLQRILRENVNALEVKNSDTLDFVRSQQMPSAVKIELANQVRRNASEVLYVLSISNNKADLQTYIDTSPLFRGAGAPS